MKSRKFYFMVNSCDERQVKVILHLFYVMQALDYPNVQWCEEMAHEVFQVLF